MDYNELSKFLDLVSNASAYKAKVKELQDREEQIKKAAGGAEKLQQVDKLFAIANESVEQAKANADSIIADAKSYVAKQKELIKAEYADIQEQRRVVGDIRNQGLEAEKRAKELQANLEVREKALAKSYALLHAKQEEVERERVELKERLEKLRSVMT